MIGQKIKNYSSFTFLPENLEKYRSTELYDAPLEGSMQFQHDWPKDKNITAVLFFCLKTWKMSVLSEQV